MWYTWSAAGCYQTIPIYECQDSKDFWENIVYKKKKIIIIYFIVNSLGLYLFIWLSVSLMHCLHCHTRNVQYNYKGPL